MQHACHREHCDHSQALAMQARLYRHDCLKAGGDNRLPGRQRAATALGIVSANKRLRVADQ
jgi:hypothetical protein